MNRSLLLLTIFFLTSLAFSQVVINEILYDTPGTDTNCFTELKGPPGTNLAGYWLVGVNGNPGSTQGPYDSVALVGTIPASGYFVIAQNAGVPNANQISPVVDWQNAASASGGVGDNVLLKYNGQIVDAVGYGPFSDPNALWMGEPPDNRLASAPDPFDGSSISRVPDGFDSNNNAADFQITPITPGAPNPGGPPTPQNRTLLQLRNNNANGVPVDSGVYVRVSGVANVPSGLWNTSLLDISIQNDEAGVTLRGTSSVAVNIGDSITALGYVSHYNGKTQIVGPYFQVINHGPASVQYSPIQISTGELRNDGESYEGMLIQFSNVTLGANNPWPSAGSSGSINIDDGTGIVTLRIEAGTDLDEWEQHPVAGQIIPQIVGVAGQFDYTPPYFEYYQISPRSRSDFVTTSVDEPFRYGNVRGYELKNAYPNPFNRSTEIRYTIPFGKTAEMAVFDLHGRFVRSLGESLKESGTIHWDGLNDNGEPISSGIYFIRLQNHEMLITQKVIYLP